MTTTNKPMTGEQLDELMTVSVNMQRSGEMVKDRGAATFAHAVQIAVMEIRDTRSQLEESQDKLTESERYGRSADITIENLERKVEQLAAELSTVDAIHNDAVFITDDHYEQCPPEVQKMIRSLAVLQIPAYKAFLAEVRAEGAELYGNHTIQIGEEENDEDIIYAGKQALLFADQLRKGGVE
ncbi:hypothetical protein [Escherichia coli]|uniref:hypothetical protein n=1 Tax=Escherichia coli TaxID=562 RepID=UPI003EE8C546